MRKVDIAIIGAGHAGLNALKAVKKTGLSWVVIEGGELGTTCARTGCMPSKVIIELAQHFHIRSGGKKATPADIEELMEEVRDKRDIFVDLILENSTDAMKDRVELLRGTARFVGPNELDVNGERIVARRIIVASGSSSLIPEPWKKLGDKLLSSDTLFDITQLPESIAVIGMGPIGLEIGQALSRLGVRVVGFDTANTLARISDPLVNRTAIEIFNREFPINLESEVKIANDINGVRISVNGLSVNTETVFAAIGRKPNIPEGLENYCELDSNGLPVFDPRSMQIGDLPVFLAGDASGTRMLLQDAADEGQIAGMNAIKKEPLMYQRKAPMAIAFTDPNIAQVGATLDEVPHAVVGQQRFGPIGRALIMGRNRGVICLYAEPTSGQVLGASMVGPRVEHLAHLLAWAVQQRMTVDEMLRMPFYHPVIEEGLQDALKETAKKLATAASKQQVSQRAKEMLDAGNPPTFAVVN